MMQAVKIQGTEEALSSYIWLKEAVMNDCKHNAHRNDSTPLKLCDFSQLMWGVCRIISDTSVSNNPTISITFFRSAFTFITHVYQGGWTGGGYNIYIFYMIFALFAHDSHWL